MTTLITAKGDIISHWALDNILPVIATRLHDGLNFQPCTHLSLIWPFQLGWSWKEGGVPFLVNFAPLWAPLHQSAPVFHSVIPGPFYNVEGLAISSISFGQSWAWAIIDLVFILSQTFTYLRVSLLPRYSFGSPSNNLCGKSKECLWVSYFLQ